MYQYFFDTTHRTIFDYMRKHIAEKHPNEAKRITRKRKSENRNNQTIAKRIRIKKKLKLKDKETRMNRKMNIILYKSEYIFQTQTI